MREFDIFMVGWFVGMIVGASVAIYTFSSVEKEIRTSTPITPEKLLTTDGKKIDTIYIYKNEKN